MIGWGFVYGCCSTHTYTYTCIYTCMCIYNLLALPGWPSSHLSFAPKAARLYCCFARVLVVTLFYPDSFFHSTVLFKPLSVIKVINWFRQSGETYLAKCCVDIVNEIYDIFSISNALQEFFSAHFIIFPFFPFILTSLACKVPLMDFDSYTTKWICKIFFKLITNNYIINLVYL